MERNRTSLLVQTFKELNTQFGNQNRRIHPPLAFNRVKVTFKDEPGEGSGVARSFYTSVAEALLANEKLPSLETAQVGASKYSSSFSNMLRHRGGSGRESSSSRKGSNSKTLWRPNRDNKKLNYDARPFRPASQEGEWCFYFLIFKIFEFLYVPLALIINYDEKLVILDFILILILFFV